MSAESPVVHSRLPRIAIVDGGRSPFVRSFGALNDVDPVSLSTHVAREVLYRNQVSAEEVDQVIWGTVISVVRSPNVICVMFSPHFPKQTPNVIQNHELSCPTSILK